MMEGLRKPKRAWLYLTKDATLVHYAKRIKVERYHAFSAAYAIWYGRHIAERIMPVNRIARMMP